MEIRALCFVGATLFSNLALSVDCDCGPTFCKETPVYKIKLQEKIKKSLDDGVPKRLVDLYKSLGKCEASITSAPDGFSILRKTNDGVLTVDSWTSENESADADLLKSGELQACYVIVSRHAFKCCSDDTFDKRSDYNKSLDLNTTSANVCEK
jgi:hypothetical protein